MIFDKKRKRKLLDKEKGDIVIKINRLKAAYNVFEFFYYR